MAGWSRASSPLSVGRAGRLVLVASVLALVAGPTLGAPPAPAPGLEALLAAFAEMPGLQARFVEEKHLALLAVPLRSEGALYYAPPGHLVRHTTKPARSVLLVEPDRVRFGDDRKVETIDLGSRPVVRMFVESFVKILQGDEAALRRLYTIQLVERPGGDRAWSLSLRPRISPMDKIFERIDLEGVGLSVSTMTMTEVDGDRTVTTFADVDTARVFSAAERSRLFRADAAP